MPGSRGLNEVSPERWLISPRARPRDVLALFPSAKVVQFDSPLPDKVLTAIEQGLREAPETELYVYGVRWPENHGIDFLEQFSFVKKIALGVWNLSSLSILRNFRDLRYLGLNHLRDAPDLGPLRGMEHLQSLYLPGPVRNEGVLKDLTNLHTLGMPGSQGLIDAVADHPALTRLILKFGTAGDLKPLASIPGLRDVSIWQLQKANPQTLAPLGRTRVEALELGAMRNVDSLSVLGEMKSSVKYLALEKMPALDTIEPLAALDDLRALSLFEARPADKSLRSLHGLESLDDLVVSDVYPNAEVDALIKASPATRYRVRRRGKDSEGSKEPVQLHWRSLFRYVDEQRSSAGGR